MANLKETYARLVAAVELRVEILKLKVFLLVGVGLTAAERRQGAAYLVRLEKLSGEQAALEEALKRNEAALKAAYREGQAYDRRTKKLIKLAYPNDPEKWKEFGITDRK